MAYGSFQGSYGLPLGAPRGPLAFIWSRDPQAINSLPIKTLDMKFGVFNSKMWILCLFHTSVALGISPRGPLGALSRSHGPVTLQQSILGPSRP